MKLKLHRTLQWGSFTLLQPQFRYR